MIAPAADVAVLFVVLYCVDIAALKTHSVVGSEVSRDDRFKSHVLFLFPFLSLPF